MALNFTSDPEKVRHSEESLEEWHPVNERGFFIGDDYSHVVIGYRSQWVVVSAFIQCTCSSH